MISANVIRIWSPLTADFHLPVQVGDTVHLGVMVGLDNQPYNGISCYIRYNSQVFEPLDQYPAKVDLQPFHSQEIFPDGEILSNKVIMPGIMAYSEGHLSHTVRNDTTLLCTFSLRVKNKLVKRSAIVFDPEPVYVSLASTPSGTTVEFSQQDTLNLIIRPSVPPGFAADDLPGDHGGRIRLSWSLSDDAISRPDYIDGYHIYRRKVPDGIFKQQVEMGPSTTSWIDSVEVSRIEDTVNYEYYIVAYNEFGESLPSPVRRAFGLDNYPIGFDLLAPTDSLIVPYSSPVLFRWQSSRDPDRALLSYRLVISLDSLFQNPVYQSVIQDTIDGYIPPPLENSVFYWRVIAVDQEQLEVPSDSRRRFYLNRIPEPPSISQLLHPRFPAIVTDSLPVFTWSTSIDPDPFDSVFYRLEISESSDFAVPRRYSEIPDTVYRIPQKLTDDRKYYWRIMAYNRNGLASFSPVDSFFLNFRLVVPSEFEITYPQPDQSFTQTGFEMIYTASTDQDLFDTVTYHIYYSTSPDFQPMDSVHTRLTHYQFTNLKDNSVYYFQVVARDRFGLKRAAVPETLRIVIDQFNLSPNSFLLLKPDSAAAFKEGEVMLLWNRAIDTDPLDTVRYRVVIGNTPAQLNLYASGLFDTTLVIPVSSLTEDLKYYWSVQAVDNEGHIRTALQPGWFFFKNTGNNPPGSFILMNPGNFNVVTDLHPVFRWSKSIDSDPGDSVTYTFYLKDSLNLNVIDSVNLLRDTSLYYTRNLILENRLYAWDVAARDRSGVTTYAAQVYYFFTNTLNEPPSGFNLITPANESIMKSESQIFRWNQSRDNDPGDSVYYRIQFSLQPSFNSYWDTTVADTGLVVAPSHFVTDTIYYWRVWAVDRQNAKRQSNQSYHFRFDTRNPDFSVWLTQSRDFPQYLKFFIQANEVLSSGPQMTLDGKLVGVQATDPNRNLYFTSIHLDSLGIQSLRVRISARDQVGNLGTLDQDILIYSGALAKFEWPTEAGIWKAGYNGFYMVSCPDTAEQDDWFSLNPMNENTRLDLELVTVYPLFCGSTEMPFESAGNGQRKYSLDWPGTYRLERISASADTRWITSLSVYPNPFNHQLEIRFYPIHEEPVEVVVYNLMGQMIEVLFRGIPSRPCHTVTWNPSGQGRSTGLYLIATLRHGRIDEIKKVMYLK